MKKIASIGIALVLTMCLSLSVFAASSGFVSSPSNNQAPELIGFSSASEDCTAEINITSFADRKTLPADVLAKIEKAYQDILSNPDLSKLCPALAQHSESLGVPVSELSVSDLFDISYSDCEGHNDHGAFDITIKPEYLEKFVGLIHYNGTAWELLADAKVENENHLTFTVEDLSPFAIVVSTGTTPTYHEKPTEDNNTGVIIGATAAAVAVAGGVTAFVIWKKTKKEA